LNFLITGVLAGNDKLGLVIFDTDVTVVFPLVRRQPPREANARAIMGCRCA